jgi:hypothetical protein
VAVRSKAWVYGRSLAWISGSIPAEGMDVCLVSIVCCQVVRAGPSSRGVLPSVVCLKCVIAKPRTMGRPRPPRGCRVIGKKRRRDWFSVPFRHIFISSEKRLSASSCVSVRLSVCVSSVPTGRIFVKFDIVDFYENLSRKPTFFKNKTKMSGTLRLYCCQQYEIFCSSRPTQKWTHCCFSMAKLLILLYCLQWHVAKQDIENSLLHCHINNGYTNAPKFTLYVHCLSCSLLTVHTQSKTA